MNLVPFGKSSQTRTFPITCPYCLMHQEGNIWTSSKASQSIPFHTLLSKHSPPLIHIHAYICVYENYCFIQFERASLSMTFLSETKHDVKWSHHRNDTKTTQMESRTKSQHINAIQHRCEFLVKCGYQTGIGPTPYPVTIKDH